MKTAATFKEKIAGLDELKKVEKRLLQATSSTSRLTGDLSRHLLWRGGKRLRPLLVVLSASFGSCDEEALLDTAAAAELIHTASLIHDDIIDEAGKRRGSKSLNYLWGNKWAVLTGDFLFSRAYSLLTRHADLGVLEPMTQAISLMCEGEIEQLSWARENKIPTQSEYFTYIFKKTAYFVSACCLAGAKVSGLPPEMARALKVYGYHLGMAFQIIDDVFDLMPGSEMLGKPVGNDMRQKVITLPLLHLLADPAHSLFVTQLLQKQQLQDDEIEAVARIAYASGALAKARQKAEDHVRRGKDALPGLAREGPRDTLNHLADYVLQRDR